MSLKNCLYLAEVKREESSMMLHNSPDHSDGDGSSGVLDETSNPRRQPKEVPYEL